MAKFRVNKTKDYTVVSNYHLKDKNLSLKAKGLLTLMLSLSDNWDYSIIGLNSISKEGVKAIRNTLNELKEHRYLVIRKFNNDKGQYEYIYDIYEEPYTPKGDVVKGYAVKGTQLNTKELNTKEYTPPTVEEIRKYVQENNLLVDADYFYEYYEDTEWKDKGGDPIRNWKLKCRTWHKREVKNGNDTGAGNRERGGLRKTESGRRREDEITNTKLPPMA